MAEIVLFHHIQGLTEGVRAFGEALAAGGHRLHLPDLYEGKTAATMPEGVALMRQIGDEELTRRADAAVADLPEELVYAGISFGVPQAQRLAQTRAGARGALLFEACIPVTGEWAFGPWPQGVPVQIHGMDQDEFFALEGDIDAARELVESAGEDLAQLWVYPGDQHLFTDSSLPSYDAAATELAVQRSRELLSSVS